jgi:hypothetical protein
MQNPTDEMPKYLGEKKAHDPKTMSFPFIR